MTTKRIILICTACIIGVIAMQAERWTTYFAYNNVTQIAMAPDVVYGLSDGSLFSVNKQTEQIRVYNRQSGLHSTGITCIHYDQTGKQLIIAYSTGKIDLLSSNGVKYISELYNKDMTQLKTIYNVTIHGRTAYLSTHYGVQTMDLKENKLVDSYWLRPNGAETPIQDVVIANDSIYAFTNDSLFCAALCDNLVDYTFWKRELRTGRISPDASKGTHYSDNNDEWYAGNAEGIIRYNLTDRLTYKPQGPLTNTPYRLKATGTKLGMVQGGYAITANYSPGILMLFQNNTWTNFNTDYFNTQLGFTGIADLCDIIFDPQDSNHFYVASFGYGLLEFRQGVFYQQHTPNNSAIESVIAGASYPYIWVDGLRYDAQGNLWMTNVSANSIKVLMRDGTWHAFGNAACKGLGRAKDLIISNQNPSIKIVSSIRNGIGVMDDNGTIADQSDDQGVLCSVFKNTQGQDLILPIINSIFQMDDGSLLIATDGGLYRIEDPADLLQGNTLCTAVQVSETTTGREDIFADEGIRSITEDDLHQIWVGTALSGLYCLSPDLSQVIHHFSTENSPIPGNDIISLCFMNANKTLWVGTSEGLVSYDRDGVPEGTAHLSENENTEVDFGSMHQWRLHLSYNNATELAASTKRIFAIANGSLFSYNREDGTLEYWSRTTGLNGNTVEHIAYDTPSHQLIIAYSDGRLDLMDDEGNVHQMPDLYMKAGAIAVTVNHICIGTHYTYLAMPFGIIAIEPKKGEVNATYYIGDEAASLDITRVVERGDSLYAFTSDMMYSASLNDNLIDYHYWHASPIPVSQLQDAVCHRNEIYSLQHDSLYRLTSSAWQLVRSEPFEWLHASEGQLLLGHDHRYLYRLADDEQIEGLSSNYHINDALYSQGEYWLGEYEWGLIRLGKEGDDYLHTSGPNDNFGYKMTAAHGQIYAVSGGRWAASYLRPARMKIYDGVNWKAINHTQFTVLGKQALDASNVAVSPNDPGHFYVATYGSGLFEFRNYEAYKQYLPDNSTLRAVSSSLDPEIYTFTDGVLIDDRQNLWVLNARSPGQPLHILTPTGQWIGMPMRSEGENLKLNTPDGIWVDKRNSQRKWMLDQRVSQGVILFDDGGTPTNNSDDRCLKRGTFVDQNGNSLTPTTYLCWAQDHTNRIWLGTDKGIITIPSSVDFFTSNACRRIIIPRNDGTGLGDYLLGDEQVNCIAVDGGNRVWIGTENSGIYLIEDDTITVAHFTTNNSLLPSNSIVSITIMPHTGEVFVGTNNGIASYRSDASEPNQDMDNAYAYPNPVRPGYEGYISINGLTENTTVNIIDESGNLVCKTRSNGGTAVWDGRIHGGKLATAGIYTALCNGQNGKHSAVKIMIIR